jgi:hypothetical protein
MSFYSQYRGRCTGRIIHFLHHYCQYHIATHATIGAAHVNFGDKTIAKLAWSERFGEGDVPIFEFVDEESEHRQHNEMRRAISDGCAMAPPDEAKRKPVDAEVMMALLGDGTRRAGLYSECVLSTRPSFFVAERHVYFEAAGWYYRWDHEIGGWLLWVEGERRAA